MRLGAGFSSVPMPQVSGNTAELMQIMEYSQKAATELAEKMIKVAAEESAVLAEMTGVGMVLDLYA
jgi:hypothetical protein